MGDSLGDGNGPDGKGPHGVARAREYYAFEGNSARPGSWREAKGNGARGGEAMEKVIESVSLTGSGIVP
jgi:hypothetical protein